ncbi:MAG: ketopantoate reductase family protein [Haloferacaceae archaeon]
MEVVVVGSGALGGLVGALLDRRHDVTMVGRERQVAAIADRGLAVEGVESFRARPAATTAWDGRADLGVVAVKAHDTPGAAATLAAGTVGAVVPLGNGMGAEATLADRLAAPVVAGTATLGATAPEPGRVAWRGRGRVAVGPWTADAGRAARRAGAAFRTAGVPTTVTDAIRERLWEKLAVNAAINPLTALTGTRNGAVAAAPLDGVAAAAAREVAAVARSRGIDLPDERAVAAVREVARATADNRSSMARDLAAGRRTEVDAINGYAVEAAPDPGSVPVNRTLAALVRARESATDGREEAGSDPDPDAGAEAETGTETGTAADGPAGQSGG